jgi:hypothetical protein
VTYVYADLNDTGGGEPPGGEGGEGGEGGGKGVGGMKSSGSTTLAVAGTPVGMVGYGSILKVAADDLEIWDLDGSGSGDPHNPVKASAISLFGADPVTLMSNPQYSPATLFVTQNPVRYAMVDGSIPPEVFVDDEALAEVQGQVLAMTLIRGGDTDRVYVLTDEGVSGRLYGYDIDEVWTPLPPVLENQVDLGAGTQPIEIDPIALCDVNYSCNTYLVVVREAWGVEVYDRTLNFVTALSLPGEPSDVRRLQPAQMAVTLGDLGVAVVTDLAGTPVITYVRSNGLAPGRSLRFLPGEKVLTPDGIAWWQMSQSGGGKAFGQDPEWSTR